VLGTFNHFISYVLDVLMQADSACYIEYLGQSPRLRDREVRTDTLPAGIADSVEVKRRV
jgi:hypothetical protein